MKAKIIVDVYLIPIKNTAKPTDNTVIFAYVLDKYTPANSTNPGGVLVVTNGDIYIGNTNTSDVDIAFVLQTKNLSWGSDSYKVTLAPKPPDKAIDMLWITRETSKPLTKWDTNDNAFGGFSQLSTDPESVNVTIDKSAFKGTTDFPYALAVNFIAKDGSYSLVRNDPQIRDRGVPSSPSYPPYAVVAFGLMALALLVWLVRSANRRKTQMSQ